MANTTAFMLLYGDYPALHLRVLSSLFERTPNDTETRLWLNAVCSETLVWLLERMPANTLLYVNDENRPKYEAMRLMFHHPRYRITTPWITWFDDDAIIMKPDWYEKTTEFIASREQERICFFGQQRRKGHQPGIRKFVRQADWFKDRKFQRIKGEAGSGYRGPGIVFIQGSYWWLRTAVMMKLLWPDVRLSHNGGDTLLSEALWQQRLPQHEFFYGVAPNSAPRRGLSETPAGFSQASIPLTDKRPATMVGEMEQYKELLAQRSMGFIQQDQRTILVKRGMAPKPGSVIVPGRRLVTHRELLAGRARRKRGH